MRDAFNRKGITEVELQIGKSGQFDVFIDGKLGYSRHATGRFPSDQDIDKLAPG